MSFKRMCAENGRPRYVYSDCAGYFRRAKDELYESFSNLNKALDGFSEKYHFQWTMNAQLAPHAAGIWERLIRTMKTCLLKVCRNALLTYVEFLTVLKEVQALMNDRPLVGMSEDAIDVLTPSLLTHGKKMRPFQESFGYSELPGKNDAKVRWEHRSKVMDHFHDLWRKQYRLSLQQRRKWTTPKPDIKVGDIVVLHQKLMKRGYWPLARVVEILPGRDQTVRRLRLAVPRRDKEGKIMTPAIYERSVHEVCPLELSREELEESEGEVPHKNRSLGGELFYEDEENLLGTND